MPRRRQARLGWADGLAARDTVAMGFDATRQQRRRRSDVWIVAAALAVCLLAVVWALLG